MFEEKITFDKFIRWFLVAALIFAVFYVVNYLSHALLPFFIAWFIAYLLNPVVKFVQYKLRVKVRPIAVIITMLLVVIVISCVVFAIVPPMINQVEKLGDAANKYVLHTANGNRITVMVREWIQEYLPQIRHYINSADFTATIKSSIPKLFSFLGQTASIVFSVIASFITLLYLFFILLDYERLAKNFIRIFPKKQRPFWTDLMQDVESELNNYIRGQGLVGLTMGILFCIGFTIIDFPIAIGMGILIGVLTLIPYMHVLAFIPMVFLSLIKAVDTGQNFWVVFGTATLVFAIIQIINDLIVTPKIMGKAMNLNPAILLLSLSVWGSLLGFIGLIVALPLTTLIIAYWKRYVTKEDKEDTVTIEDCEKQE
ncbi:MAG: AI-2E family transporter [Prevotella pallens]|nr:AI-2E family transporter [Prevotella pallens]